jgi:hypothetical protein
LSQHYIFETGRLIVRQYNYDRDKENFHCINGDEDVMRYIRPGTLNSILKLAQIEMK